MSKVALVTDSTAYIPREYLNKYHISVAPQVLIWENETFKDGVDIQPDEFYRRLENAKVMPSTSQASPQSFHDIFSCLIEEGYDVLAVLISEKLSGTIASAVQAKELLPQGKIEIIDSRTTAMAMGYLVLAGARLAAEGASLAECKEVVQRNINNTGLVFAVDTLEFLHRGGRIGGGTRLLGTALNIKPILEVEDGLVDSVEKVRTRKKSLARLIELTEQRINGRSPIRIATLHANALDEAKILLEEAQKKFDAVECILSEVSPVVGTHAGPGTVGLAFIAGE